MAAGVWLSTFPRLADRAGVSLAFTTYQTGKLCFVGNKSDGQLAVFERSFQRSMGLCADSAAQTLWMSTQFQLWRFENVLQEGASEGEFDRLYVPRVGYTIGDLDAHDVATQADGRLLFVNTLFSCLATTSERLSFNCVWRPSFISKLAAEDRCHLNGLALENG